MSDSLGKIVSIFLAVILMFIFPLIYMTERMESAEQLFLISESTQFVDSICSTGILTRSSVDAFNKNLQSKNSVYDVKIYYEKKDAVIGDDGVVTVSDRLMDEEDIYRALEIEEKLILERGAFLKVYIRKIAGFRLSFVPAEKNVSAYYGATVRGNNSATF